MSLSHLCGGIFSHSIALLQPREALQARIACCITQVCLNFRARTDGWTVVLQDFVLEIKIHGSINYSKSSMSWSRSSKKAPDHHTNTTMFDCCFDQSKEYFPMSHEDYQECFWLLLFPFWSAVVFFLGNLPWMPFLTSLFLTVEPWTLILTDWSEANTLDYVMGSFVISCMHRQLVDWDSSFPSINKNCHFKTVFCIYLFDDLNPVSVPNMWKEERNQQGANTFSQHCIGNKRVNIGRLDNTGRKKIVHRNSKTLCLAYFNTLIKNCASLMWLKLLNQNFKTFSQDKNAKTNLNSFKCIQFPRNLDIFPTNSNDRNPACKERLNYFFISIQKWHIWQMSLAISAGGVQGKAAHHCCLCVSLLCML